MKKTFEEIAIETIRMYIAAKTDRNGYCNAGYEYSNISDITQQIKDIANELHEN